MLNWSFHKYAPTSNDKVTSVHAQCVLENFNRHINSTVEFPYVMDEKAMDTMTAWFSPAPIGYTKTPTRHVHSFIANLNWFAYQECREIARNFFKDRAIDIGGVPIRTPKKHHICALIDDARSYQRYIENDVIMGTNMYSGKYISCCKDGVQSCNFKSEYGYAINVYDINMEDWPVIFGRHHFKMVDLWMFMPLCLIEDQYTRDQTMYKVYRDGDYCFFDPMDGSNGYRHLYHNWRKYNDVTLIRANNYDITVEHKARYGSFVQIRLVKVPKTNMTVHNRISRVLPISPYDTTYVVPDLLTWCANSFATNMRGNLYGRVFYVNKEFVDKVMAWASRSVSTSYSFQNMCAQMDTHKGAVFYNLNGMYSMVYSGISISEDEYHRLQFSLYILGAVHRFESTQGVKAIFKHMQDNEPGMWSDIKNHLRYVIHHILMRPTASAIAGTFESYIDNLSDDHWNDIYRLKLKSPVAPLKKEWLDVNYDIPDYNFSTPTILPSAPVASAPRVPASGTTPSTTFSRTFRGFGLRFGQPRPTNVNTSSDDVGPITDDAAKNLKAQGKSASAGVSADKFTNHWRILYNPPGVGGCCGRECLEFLFGKKMVMPATKNVAGKDVPLAPNWWNADDLFAVCAANKSNLFVHQVRLDMIEVDAQEANSAFGWVRLLNYNAHWYVIKCDCPTCDVVIGDYSSLGVHKDFVYVNCANEQCTDGAGQAAAFRKMFNGYQKNVNLPIKNNFLHMNWKGTDLAICVAYDNRVKVDVQASNKAYRNIIGGLNSLGPNKHVYLPMIGTNIFRNELCCFKRNIKELKIPYTLCFFNRKQYDDFLNCDGCKHGGYFPVNEQDVQIKRGNVVDKNYCNINAGRVPGKMVNKAKDLFDYVDYYFGEGVTVCEVALAPGGFCSFASKNNKKYVGFNYEGPGALGLFDGIKPLGNWSSQNQLIPLIKRNVSGKFVLLYDNLIEDDFELIDFLVKYHKNDPNCVGVITKVEAYFSGVGVDHFTTFANRFELRNSMQFWFNSGSEPVSSEIYATLSGFKPDLQIGMSADKIISDRNAAVVEKIKKMKCTCKHGYMANVNGSLDYEIDMVVYKRFLNNLMSDPLVVSKFSDKVKKRILDAVPVNGSLQLILGVAGASKSKAVKNGSCICCTKVISPFNVLAKEFNSVHPNIAITFYKALEMDIDHDYIVLDEALYLNPNLIALYKAIWPNSVFVGLSDQYQIDVRDFETDLPPSYKVRLTGGYINVTNRMPQYVVDVLKNYIPELKTTNKFEGSISFVEDMDSLSKLVPRKGLVVLTHTQKLCEIVKKAFSKLSVRTVNQAMGGTWDEVHILTCDINEIISDRIRFVYTGMSRTERELVLYGSKGEVEQYLMILDSVVSRALNSVDVIPVPDTRYEQDVVKGKPKSNISHTTSVADIVAMQDILSNFFQPVNCITENGVNYSLNIIAEHGGGGKFRTHENQMVAFDVTITGGTINFAFGGHTYQMEYHGKQSLALVNAALSRYSIPAEHVDRAGLKLIMDGVNKFVDSKKLAKVSKITKDEEWANAIEYLIALQKKLNNGQESVVCTSSDVDKISDGELEVSLGELITDGKFSLSVVLDLMLKEKTEKKFLDLQTEFCETYHEIVDFHLKRQPKEIRGAAYDAIYKAGQGISAWSKLMNLVISCVVRGADKRLISVLKNNVHLAYGKSDAEIGTEVAFYAKYINDRNYAKLGADVSQFDRTQSNAVLACNVAEFEWYGCQPWFTKLYMRNRSSWTLSALDNTGEVLTKLKIAGHFQQHSGQPATLHGNTFTVLGEFGACIDFEDMVCAFFKGDDSLMICRKFKQAKVRNDYVTKKLGINLKIDTGEFVEFIANIVTPSGFFPDVIRRLSRIFKIYTNPEDWKEIVKSLADCLDVIVNLEEGAIVAHRYYGSKGFTISPDEIKSIVHFLKKATYSDDLRPQINKNLTFCSVNIENYVSHYNRSIIRDCN